MKYILGLSLGLLMAGIGCAKIEFTDADGNMAKYSRLGRTDLKDIEYENNGIKLKVGAAKGDSGRLGNALINATKALENTTETALNASKVVAPLFP